MGESCLDFIWKDEVSMRKYLTLNVDSPRFGRPEENQEVIGVYVIGTPEGKEDVEFKLLSFMDGEYKTYDVEYGWLWHSKPHLWIELPGVDSAKRMLERIEG